MKIENLTPRDLELLDKYNEFLLKHNFTDWDIFGEGVDSQSSINMFIAENGWKVREVL